MQLNSTILAFDTTGILDSIALHHNGQITSKTLPCGGSQLQSSILVPSLQDLLLTHNLTFKDVKALATVSGPGSFTGIRIGLAAAQGLILASGYKPVIPTLLELLSFAAQEQSVKDSVKKVLCLIDTKRGDYFAQIFTSSMEAITPACIVSAEEIKDIAHAMIVVSNNVISDLQNVLIPKESVAELLIKFSLATDLKGGGNLYQDLSPFYVRHPEFKKQKRFL